MRCVLLADNSSLESEKERLALWLAISTDIINATPNAIPVIRRKLWRRCCFIKPNVTFKSGKLIALVLNKSAVVNGVDFVGVAYYFTAVSGDYHRFTGFPRNREKEL